MYQHSGDRSDNESKDLLRFFITKNVSILLFVYEITKHEDVCCFYKLALVIRTKKSWAEFKNIFRNKLVSLERGKEFTRVS